MASSSSNFQERPQYSVYVGNLPDGILQSHVEQKIFAGLGVENVRLVKDKETDKFRGFAYVDLKTKEDYVEALKRNGVMINERPLRISPSERNNQNRNGPRPGNDRRNNQGRNQYPNQLQNNYNNGNQRNNVSNYSNNGYSGPRQSGWQESGPRGPRHHSPRYSQNPQSNFSNPRKSNYPRGNGSSNRGNSGKGRSTLSSDEFKYVDDPNRPRVKIGDPEAVINPSPEVDLSNKFTRNVSIFGEGKPREASPLRQKE